MSYTKQLFILKRHNGLGVTIAFMGDSLTFKDQITLRIEKAKNGLSKPIDSDCRDVPSKLDQLHKHALKRDFYKALNNKLLRLRDNRNGLYTEVENHLIMCGDVGYSLTIKEITL